MSNTIKTAVVTGNHAFDVVNFHLLLRRLDDIDSYVQHLDDLASSPQAVRDAYDVVLFYFMPTHSPSDANLPWYAGQPRAALERILETGQGIVILHHGLLAYPQWPEWSALVGIVNREFGYHPEQTIRVEIADSEHPITTGLSDWEMVDETYTMKQPASDSHVLLTVDHPHSIRAVAWTRRVGQNRVFCLVLGHDNRAWSQHNFQQVLGRGIRWAGGAL
jgi:type 1 glutamine amidotransferase